MCGEGGDGALFALFQGGEGVFLIGGGGVVEAFDWAALHHLVRLQLLVLPCAFVP